MNVLEDNVQRLMTTSKSYSEFDDSRRGAELESKLDSFKEMNATLFDELM